LCFTEVVYLWCFAKLFHLIIDYSGFYLHLCGRIGRVSISLINIYCTLGDTDGWHTMEQHFHSPSYYYYFPISDFTINILYYYHMLHSKLDIYVLFYFYHTSISGTSQNHYLWKPADFICPSRNRFSEVPLYQQSWTSWRLCQRYMFFFITVTEVYLVVPGYQIYMVSIHQKSWLVYQHVFLYYSDGNLPCSARLPDTSGISTPEELTGLPTCFSLLQWRKSTL
jgi:hypothetical protein